MSEYFQIGTVADRTGVPIETIRFYEREGLIQCAKRTVSNYRLFDDQAVERLRFVQHAKSLGFTLGEIRELLRVQDADSRADIKAIASAHLKTVEARIATLTAMRDTLALAVAQCDGKGGVVGCPIIESIHPLAAAPDDANAGENAERSPAPGKDICP